MRCERTSSLTESHILLPDAPAPSALPGGWSRDDAAAVTTLVAPEGDLRVSFVVAQNRATPADTAYDAWRAVDAAFDLPVLNRDESASTDGWDVVHRIAFATPAAEKRSAVAILRLLGDRAYVCLLYGAKAALSRRLAQIFEVIGAWRPAGLAELDLNDRDAATWSSKETDALAGFVQAAMRELKIPGAAIAIVQDGAIVFARGFGVTSVDDPRPVTADTRFMIGSTTKPLTTLMMARLVETGRLAWSTPVTDALPGFALADPDVTATLQMRHTVGASTGMPRRDLDLLFRVRGITAADRIAEMRDMLPTTGFGETFQYSNYLVAAGGFAAARAFEPRGSLEDAFDRAMHACVFEPLGMTRSSVRVGSEPDVDEAAPHALAVDGAIVTMDPAIERFADAVAPAGAIRSTARDVARYLVLELAGGAAPGERRAPQVKIDRKSSYGLGLFLTKVSGIDLIGHGGNTLGFTSDMFFLPAKGLGVVLLTNVRIANAFLAATRQRIFELVFAAPSTAERMVASAVKSMHLALESVRARVVVDADATAWFAGWIGDYACPQLGPARIGRVENGFRIDFESWGSELGSETQADGSKLMVLTSPPWSGTLRLHARPNGDELALDGGQTTYVFTRSSPRAPSRAPG